MRVDQPGGDRAALHRWKPIDHARPMSDNDHLDAQLALVHARLVRDFGPSVGEEHVSACLRDAMVSLGELRVTTYVPVLVEKQARQRLRALVAA